MNPCFHYLILVLCLQPGLLDAQSNFSPPMPGRMRLSGTFCEFRSDHFHSGIDIRTDGKTGKPVYAIEDGYIYRIKVSATGYGKALYIAHPGNFLSVYAHLSAFDSLTADTIVKRQYAMESFEQEFFPDSGVFPVKKDQIIGYSGNSGGSEGPHLHFEIREHHTEEPLNPLSLGYSIQDTIPPAVNAFAWYEFDNGQYIYKGDRMCKGGTDTLTVNADTAALALQVKDVMNDGSPAVLGIYGITLVTGRDTIYHFQLERMNFNHTRSVNAQLDDRLYRNSGRKFIRCHTLPGNEMPVFKNAGRGWFAVKDSMEILAFVTDRNGNITSQRFFIFKGNVKHKRRKPQFVFPRSEFSFHKGGMFIHLNDSAFFQTEDDVHISRGRVNRQRFVRISPDGLSLRRPATIAMNLPPKWKEFRDKAVIVSLDDHGNIKNSAGGVWKNNRVESIVRSFGTYALAIDTMSPSCTIKKVYQSSEDGKSYFGIVIKDDLSGIIEYECRVNGKWHLFEYDAKNALLYADMNSLPENFLLEVRLKDRKNNQALISGKYNIRSSE